MIASGIFTIAGIVAWQNIIDETNKSGYSALFMFVCFAIAGLCGAGVIS